MTTVPQHTGTMRVAKSPQALSPCNGAETARLSVLRKFTINSRRCQLSAAVTELHTHHHCQVSLRDSQSAKPWWVGTLCCSLLSLMFLSLCCLLLLPHLALPAPARRCLS